MSSDPSKPSFGVLFFFAAMLAAGIPSALSAEGGHRPLQLLSTSISITMVAAITSPPHHPGNCCVFDWSGFPEYRPVRRGRRSRQCPVGMRGDHRPHLPSDCRAGIVAGRCGRMPSSAVLSLRLSEGFSPKCRGTDSPRQGQPSWLRRQQLPHGLFVELILRGATSGCADYPL